MNLDALYLVKLIFGKYFCYSDSNCVTASLQLQLYLDANCIPGATELITQLSFVENLTAIHQWFHIKAS